MATWIDWSNVQNNKCSLAGQVLDSNGAPLDLTNYTLQLVIKSTQSAADGTGVTYIPTITVPKLGKWTLTIAASAFATPESQWYRLDVVDGGGAIVTANLGNQETKAA